MKKLGLAIAALALVGLMAGSAMAVKPAPGTKGNGLPLIPMNNSYRLILSAHDICPTADNGSGGGRVIFLQADFGDFDGAGGRHPDVNFLNTNDIELTAGDDFDVIDANACDADAAQFQLPTDVSTTFLVFLRVIGPLNSGIDIATCGIDTDDGSTVCNTAVVKVHDPRGPAKDNKFMDVTRDLLNLAGEDLFSTTDDFEIVFWEVFTNGRAKAHLVFVPCGGTALDGTPLPDCQSF